MSVSGIKFEGESEKLYVKTVEGETQKKRGPQRILARFFYITPEVKKEGRQIKHLEGADITYEDPDCFDKFLEFVKTQTTVYAQLNASFMIGHDRFREKVSAVKWISAAATIKERMVYSTTFSAFATKKDLFKVEIADADELTLANFVNKFLKEAGGSKITNFCGKDCQHCD
uniref:Uncharacterized LOC100175175 n=1 Tax=Ciona intestinalis TaxID=7719 RepID=F6X3K4_CIOIN|nr:uncharacterized protein LOC100175175 [Ciona intestinalis]|eukprot:XP_002130999.1 uncharacterized protein LOC100175175 [Ciona intestinalis]